VLNAPGGARHLQIPDKLLFFLTKRAPYKVAHGGRGSAKSWAVADSLLIRGSQEKIRIMCAREYQNSIAESVHHLLESRIEALGLSAFYKVQRDLIASTTGTEIFFVGLHNNVKNLKSTEAVDICWVEEAESVTEESWATLLPTIRKRGSEVWVTFNPDNEDDPTSQRWIVNPPPEAIVVPVNWMDNPFFYDGTLAMQKDHAYRTDPESAAHIWGGEFRTKSDAQIFKGKYSVQVFEPDPKRWGVPRYGADWGFSRDPVAAGKAWVFDRKLWVEQEVCEIGVDIDRLPALFDTVEGMKRGVCWADSARPETVSYMNNHGYPLIFSVKKWAGSIEDGIAFMRSFDEIVIHPRCKNMVSEMRLYRYKVDRLSGKTLPDIVDANNHSIDWLRYSLSSDIQQASGSVKSLRMW